MSEKKKSKLPKIIGVLFALIIVGGIIFAMNFSSVAKSLAEKVATNTLGVSVSINDLDIDFQERKITLSGIAVDNPRSYNKFDNALELSSVSIDAKSFSKELLEFDDISVGTTNVFLEVNNKGTNLGTIKDNLNTKKPDTKAEEKAQEAIKVIISKLNLGNTNLYANVSAISKDDMKMSLPTISLSGIGERSNGILAREAIAQVMDKIINVASSTAAKEGLFKEIGPQQLESLGVPSGGIMEKLDSTTGDVTNKIQGILGR